MVHDREQRQVVVRIAVEPAVFESFAVRCHPHLKTFDLAFAVAGNAFHIAGVAAVAHLGFGRNQVWDAERRRDRRGDEAVGGGDDDQRMPARAVVLHQRRGLGRDHRVDLFPHEAGMPGAQRVEVVAGQRSQGECQELADIERAGPVLGIITLVFTSVSFAIHHVVLNQELAPSVIGIAAQQRVVEIKDGERHDAAAEVWVGSVKRTRRLFTFSAPPDPRCAHCCHPRWWRGSDRSPTGARVRRTARGAENASRSRRFPGSENTPRCPVGG